MSGLVSIFFTLWRRSKGADLTNKIFWFVAALCLVFALFLVWRDGQASLLNTKQELSKAEDQNAPKLNGKIDQVIIGDSADAKGTPVFIDISIGNTGGPSVIVSYSLDINSLPDFQYKQSPAEFPKEYTLPLNEKKSNVILHHQDSIVEKTAKPIERGNLVRGWLKFIVEDVKPEIIRRPKTQFKVSFKDILGQTYSATYEMPQHSVNP